MSGFVSRRASTFIIGLMVLIGFGLVARSANAAVDAFLQIEGVRGESKDDKHKDWIQVESFSWGTNRASSMGTAASGAGAGKVALHEFTITKLVDAASPKLAQFMSTGQHIPKMVLDVGGRIYTFEDAAITSVRMEGEKEVVTIRYAGVTTAPGATHPMENMNSPMMQRPH